jgi:hypothetical protein
VAYVVVPYSVVDDRRLKLGFFVYGVYDKYCFFKGDVDANGDVVVLKVPGGEAICEVLKFKYPNRKRTLLDAAGHAWPGPTYLPQNTLVLKYIVDMTLGSDSVDLQSLKVDELRGQNVCFLDGQPDNSNVGNTCFQRTTSASWIQAASNLSSL